jgi:hypothetical protein
MRKQLPLAGCINAVDLDGKKSDQLGSMRRAFKK